MKVGLVCPYDMGAHGGVQDQVIRLARWLQGAGHDTTIIAPGEADLRRPEIASLFDTGLTARIPDEGALQLTKDAAFPRRMGRPHEYATMAIAREDRARSGARQAI